MTAMYRTDRPSNRAFRVASRFDASSTWADSADGRTVAAAESVSVETDWQHGRAPRPIDGRYITHRRRGTEWHWQ